MSDEFTRKRIMSGLLDSLLVPNSASESIPDEIQESLKMDWRILLRRSILNAKEDCTLVVYNMNHVVYGKKLIRDNDIKLAIKFAVYEDEELQSHVPVGSVVIV